MTLCFINFICLSENISLGKIYICLLSKAKTRKYDVWPFWLDLIANVSMTFKRTMRMFKKNLLLLLASKVDPNIYFPEPCSFISIYN